MIVDKNSQNAFRNSSARSGRRDRMRNHYLRLHPTDRTKLIALALGIFLLALAGEVLTGILFGRLLRADAESTAQAWAGTLLDSAVDIPDVINGMPPSDRTARLFNESTDVGPVYRYRLWDLQGRQVAMSERMPGTPNPKSMAEHCGAQGAHAVLTGLTCTSLEISHIAANPKHFACSYVPIIKDAKVVGVLEVYVDIQQHTILFMKSFLLIKLIAAITVFLAGGIPVYLFQRKMKEQRAAAAEAQFLAEHDNLTGIANRRRLEESAASALAWSRRSQTQVAALILDLDHFKDINDGYGHAAGDELLRKFAHRIASTIREEDTVARLGGDEFVILQVGIPQPVGAKALAERLLAAFAEPYDLAGIQIQCDSSIGVAIAPEDASDWDRLLSCADAALYKSKASGRKSVSFFQPGMDASLRERRRLELDLYRALQTKAFSLAYQPISSFNEGTLLGFEALLRWPEGWPTICPNEFIPIAEECGLMPAIGAWVLEAACTTAVAWQKPLKIAVNLSPSQFRQGDIVATVKNALKLSGLPAEQLELEITENLWIENTDAVLDQLTQLKRLGVSITLDDFGTGDSSLKYLWKFPFDRVKIDRSFVQEMETNPKAAAVVNTILAMGTSLHLTISAEGVETIAQAQQLNDSGCDQAQGFLLGRPLSAASADALIKAGLPSRLAEISYEV